MTTGHGIQPHTYLIAKLVNIICLTGGFCKPNYNWGGHSVNHNLSMDCCTYLVGNH
jgi:hypothetical protein